MTKQIIILTAALLLAAVLGSHAQSPGSESVYGGSNSVKSIITGGTSSDVSERLYIGPGTHLIDGTWEIYAQQIVIDPLAVITGNGSIQIYNPGDLAPIYPAAVSTPTSIDGNAPLIGAASNIDVNIQHFNNAGIQLVNMDFPADLVLDGWVNVSNSSSLYVGRDLSLEVDGADITLGTSGVAGDLRFQSDATISGYRPARMVITNNSVLSHVVKEGYTSAFIFPVGIADGDYTPAQISNGSNNTVRVSVQDYTASASPEALTDGTVNTADGMNRTWHIYADNAAVSSTVNLQHNSSTNQTGFVDATHFVTQWGTSTPNTTGDFTVAYSMSSWQTNTQGAGATGTLLTGAATLAGSSMRSRTYSSLATSALANESYFTKSADSEHPLPVKLLSFKASPRECAALVAWEMASQQDAAAYQLLHSTDGVQFALLASIKPDQTNGRYSYLHSDPGPGTHYYRLKMLEHDGAGSYSATERVQLSCGSSATRLTVYPNPATELLTVEGMLPQQRYLLRLMSMDGRVVAGHAYEGSKAQLPVGQLPPASYILQLIHHNEILMNVKVEKW